MAAEQGKLNDVNEPEKPYGTTPYPQRATNLDKPSDKPVEEGENSGRSARIKEEIDRTRARMDQTVDEIESRMKPRHLVDELLGMFDTEAGREKAEMVKEKARAAGSRVVESVRANPVPALLIGAGVAWLILGGAGLIAGAGAAAAQKKSSGLRRYPRPNARYADDPSSDEWYDQNEGSTGLDSEDQRRRRGVISTAREKLSHAAETVREKAHDATEAVRSHLPSLPHHNGESHTNGESYTGAARRHYREVVEEAPRVLREAPRKAIAKTNEFVHDQPLAAGAAALAAGIALGLLLPTTHREEELIGQGADQIRRRVRDTGKDLLERGKHVASSVAHAAVEAAEREGLTVESAKEKLGNVVDDAKAATTNAVKEVAAVGTRMSGSGAASNPNATPGSTTRNPGSGTGSSIRPSSDPSV